MLGVIDLKKKNGIALALKEFNLTGKKRRPKIFIITHCGMF